MKVHQIKEKALQECISEILELCAHLYEEHKDIKLILKALNISQALGIYNYNEASANEKLQMLIEQQQNLLNGFAILTNGSNKGEQQ